MSGEVGMCGARSPETSIRPSEFCILDAGHQGWHRGPTVMSAEGHVIPPINWGFGADLPVAASVLGSGETAE